MLSLLKPGVNFRFSNVTRETNVGHAPFYPGKTLKIYSNSYGAMQYGGFGGGVIHGLLTCGSHGPVYIHR